MKHLLLDSNLVIYGARAEGNRVATLVAASESVAVSVVTVIETLGYHAITHDEAAGIRRVIDACLLLPVNDQVVEKAVELRQHRRMKLGDAIIAATALVFGRALATRNVQDFSHIPALTVIDPYAESQLHE